MKQQQLLRAGHPAVFVPLPFPCALHINFVPHAEAYNPSERTTSQQYAVTKHARSSFSGLLLLLLSPLVPCSPTGKFIIWAAATMLIQAERRDASAGAMTLPLAEKMTVKVLQEKARKTTVI